MQAQAATLQAWPQVQCWDPVSLLQLHAQLHSLLRSCQTWHRWRLLSALLHEQDSSTFRMQEDPSCLHDAHVLHVTSCTC